MHMKMNVKPEQGNRMKNRYRQ